MLPTTVIAAEGTALSVSGAIADVSTCFSAAVNMISGNPIAMVFIGFGLVAGGIRLFHKVRKA